MREVSHSEITASMTGTTHSSDCTLTSNYNECWAHEHSAKRALSRTIDTGQQTVDGRIVNYVPLPQQLASGTPQRHCADAAAATAGIRDAGTSGPIRIAAAATVSTRDTAASNPSGRQEPAMSYTVHDPSRCSRHVGGTRSDGWRRRQMVSAPSIVALGDRRSPTI